MCLVLSSFCVSSPTTKKAGDARNANSQEGDVDWECNKKAGIVPSLSPNPGHTLVHIKSDLKGQRKQQLW